MTQQDDVEVAKWLESEQGVIDQVLSAIGEEFNRYHLKSDVDIAHQPLVNPHLKKDPFDGSLSFHGEWRNSKGSKCGALQIHEGGQVFAEYDVVQPHPTDTRWFIEAVTLWGNSGGLKTELSLLPALN